MSKQSGAGLEDGKSIQNQHQYRQPYLGEPVECCIGGVVGDKEPHALVGDLYSGRAVHVGETA